MFTRVMEYRTRPALYAPGTGAFWDDEHISKGMLEAHLNADWDAASRKHAYLDVSVAWIAKIAPPPHYRVLLDLGCGPGLYAERFCDAGYAVTGVDFSRRSIAYAREQASLSGRDIEYHHQDYLTIDYVEQFDIVTLIYCDYAVLSRADRLLLLEKIHRALRPGGKLVLDVFTLAVRREESRSWHVCEDGGFYSEQPYACLESVYQYTEEGCTELRQYIILTEHDVQCYNIWDHLFAEEELLSEVRSAGFRDAALYGDVAGKDHTSDSETLCAVLTK